MRRLILGLALAVLLSGAPRVNALPVGEQAPDFTLENLAGEEVGLSQLQGRPVVLVLGTSWCPGCRQQAVELEKIKASLEEQQVAVVDIFLQDSAADVEGFFRSLERTVPDLALLGNDQVSRAYQVFAIPRVLLLDRAGRILFDRVFAPGDEILDVFEKQLKQL